MKVGAQERWLWTQTGLNHVENFNPEIAMSNKFIKPNQLLRLILKKIKLPLKFIGRERATPAYPENEEQVKGKITLNYTYL